MKLFQYINIYKLKVIFVGRVLLIINYLPKWRWLVVENFFFHMLKQWDDIVQKDDYNSFISITKYSGKNSAYAARR